MDHSYTYKGSYVVGTCWDAAAMQASARTKRAHPLATVSKGLEIIHHR